MATPPKAKTSLKTFSVISALTSLLSAPMAAQDSAFASEKVENASSRSAHSTEGDGVKCVLQFPEDRAVGSVFIVPMNATHEFKEVQTAKGKVTKYVPPEHLLGFQCGTNACAHPELLDTVHVNGVELLKLTFQSFDESKPSLTDPIMKHLSKFSNVKVLQVLRSDVTDQGLATIGATMPHLTEIDAFEAASRGGFLKSFLNLPLRKLDISYCRIDQSNLAYLPKMKSLVNLNLRYTHLNKSSLSYIAQCQSLEVLHVSGNTDIDDSWMPQLLTLKKLKTLSIHDTKVTLQGLAALKPLQLSHLALPPGLNTPDDRAKVRSIFPHCKLIYSAAPRVDADNKFLFAPLH